MKKITRAKDLVDDLSYAAHYIENVKTGTSHQYAVVSGETAKEMLKLSTQPKRIFFIQEH